MADRVWSVFWAFCRWWFFGVVLGVVVGGIVGSALAPFFWTLGGAWYGGIVGAVLGLVEAPLVAPTVLLRSSPAVDRIWPGVVGFGVTFAVGYAMFIGDVEAGAELENIGILLVVTGLCGVVAAWFGEAVTRRVRIPIRHMVIGVASVGMVCAVGCAVFGPSDFGLSASGASGPGAVAEAVLGGFVCGGILGAVLIVFNQLIAEESPAR